MDLSHYTSKAEPLTQLNPEYHFSSHKTKREENGYKPTGLWVSVDGEQDWFNWCKSEEWGLERLERRYRIFLKAKANILWLSTVNQILEFTKEYEMSSILARVPGLSLGGDRMDWLAVKRQYSGLIITPYQWECRICDECFWYYGWDCASGCIWDVEAIKRFEEDVNWMGCKID